MQAVELRQEKWKRPNKELRPVCGLIYLDEGRIQYEYGDRVLNAREGDVLKFSTVVPYKGIALSDGPFRYHMIDFVMDDSSSYERFPIPNCFHPVGQKLIHDRFEAIIRLWRGTSLCRKMDVKSELYALLSTLAKDYAINCCLYNENSRILQITDYLYRHYTDADLRMERVAELFHISQSQMRRLFSSELGTSPAAYLTGLRMERAKELLGGQNEMPISEVAALCGFTSVYYFSTAFRSRVGIPPSEYRLNSQLNSNMI